jgi:hypothetical protein
MSQQPQEVSSICVTDLHSGAREDCPDSHISGVPAKMKNRDIFQAGRVSNILKIEKVKGLPFSGKEFKIAQKFVPVVPLEVPLFSKKEYHAVLTSRDMDFSITHDINMSSNDDASVKKPSSQSIPSPSVSNMASSAVCNEAPFIVTTGPKPLHLSPFLHCIQSSSHMKLTDGVLQTENKDSIMNVVSIFPEELCANKRTAVTELKLPALTQCHILPNNNSGILIASSMGDSMSVSTLPIAPEQTSNSASPVAGGSAAGTLSVAETYQAVCIGSAVHLIRLCNNSMSHVQQ